MKKGLGIRNFQETVKIEGDKVKNLHGNNVERSKFRLGL